MQRKNISNIPFNQMQFNLPYVVTRHNMLEVPLQLNLPYAVTRYNMLEVPLKERTSLNRDVKRTKQQ